MATSDTDKSLNDLNSQTAEAMSGENNSESFQISQEQEAENQPDSAESLRNQLKGTLPKKKQIYSCESCQEFFLFKSKLLEHFQNTHTTAPRVCSICGKTFLKLLELEEHMLGHSNEKIICDLCGKSSNSKRSLAVHIKRQHSEKSHICKICGKACAESWELKLHHKVIHKKQLDYNCEVCGRMFAYANALVDHRRTHSGEKLYKCEYCSKAFTHSCALKVHRRIHTKERPYKCNLCEKSYTMLEHLKNHKMTHLEQRPRSHKCLLCDKSYFTKTHLRRHTKDQHPGYRLPKKKELAEIMVVNETDPTFNIAADSEVTIVAGSQPNSVMDSVIPIQTDPEISTATEMLTTLTGEQEFVVETTPSATDTSASDNMYTFVTYEMENGESMDSFQVAIPETGVINLPGIPEGTEHIIFQVCTPQSTLPEQVVTDMVQMDEDLNNVETATIIASGDMELQLSSDSTDIKPVIQQNLMLQTNLMPHLCTLCDRRYHDKKDLRNHMWSHTGEKVKCEYCEKLLSSPASFKSHLLKQHNKVLDPENIMNCIEIQADTTSGYKESTVTKEMDPVSIEIKPRSFSVTNSNFSSTGASDPKDENQEIAQNIQSDISVAVETKNHLTRFVPLHGCDDCGKTFYYASDLRRHSLTHSQGRSRAYVCNVCGKGFPHSNRLAFHQLCHTGGAVACNVCGKQYKQEKSYKYHMRAKHSGEKSDVINFEAEVAADKIVNSLITLKTEPEDGVKKGAPDEDDMIEVPKSFYADKKMNKGDKKQKSPEKPSPVITTRSNKKQAETPSRRSARIDQGSDTKFAVPKKVNPDKTCETCGKTFKYMSNYQHHITGQHSKAQNYACTKCGKNFPKPSLLKSHKCERSGKFSCPLCNKGFVSRRGQRIHMKKMHGQEPVSDGVDSNADQSDFNEDDRTEAELGQVLANEREKCVSLGNEITNVVCEPVSDDASVHYTASDTGDKITTEFQVTNVACEPVLDDASIHYTASDGCDNIETEFENSSLPGTGATIITIIQGSQPQQNYKPTSTVHQGKTRNSHRSKLMPRKTCDTCGKQFKYISDLERHIFRHHSRKLEFECKKCGKGFAKGTLLRYHMWTHTGRISCPLCAKVFNSCSGFRKHVENLHADEEIPPDAPLNVDNCDLNDDQNMKAELENVPANMEISFLEEDKTMKVEVQESNNDEARDAHVTDISPKTQRELHSSHGKTPSSTESGPQKPDISCEVCGKVFRFRYSLTRHSVCHTKSWKHVCKICGKGYVNKIGLQHHEWTHTGKQISCEHCEKSFRSYSGYSYHCARQHPDLVKIENPLSEGYDEAMGKTNPGHPNGVRTQGATKPSFVCETCGKEFRYRCDLVKHEKAHIPGKPFMCVQCGKQFRSKRWLMHHASVKHSDQRVECDLCGKTVSSALGLKKHKKRLHGNSPWHECPNCEKLFRTEPEMKLHQKVIHEKRWDYTCEVCGQLFAYANAMKEHMRLHSGERPYKCKLCDKAFYKSCILKVHMRSHTRERPHICDVCGRRFMLLWHLRDHNLQHTGERPHQCTTCNKTFILKKHLRRHVNSVHSNVSPRMSRKKIPIAVVEDNLVFDGMATNYTQFTMATDEIAMGSEVEISMATEYLLNITE